MCMCCVCRPLSYTIANLKKTYPSSSQLKLAMVHYNQVRIYFHTHMYIRTSNNSSLWTNFMYCVCYLYLVQTLITSNPIMCCYQLVTCEFIWWGLQGRVESLIQKVTTRWPPLCIAHMYVFVILLTNLHKCSCKYSCL